MPKNPAKFTLREIDRGYNALKKTLKDIRASKAHVRVGVFEDANARTDGMTQAKLAAIHEYGAPSVGVPERSFLRSTFDARRDEYIEQLRKLVKDVYVQRISPERALGLVGVQAAADIKKGITTGDGIPPPLQAATIARKGSDRPLVDTGRLLNSITWKVVNDGR